MPAKLETSAANNPGTTQRQVCLGLGSNINPRENLPHALNLLEQFLEVEAVSTAWETPAVGSSGPDFLNAALLVSTHLSVAELKSQVIRNVESQLGRVRTENKNDPRTIDIDVLIDDGQVIEPELWDQAFLAVPVAEILPDYTNPQTGETLAQAAQRLSLITPIKPCAGVLPAGRGNDLD